MVEPVIALADVARFRPDDPAALVEASLACPVCLRSEDIEWAAGAAGLRSLGPMPMPKLRRAVAGLPGARAGASPRPDGRTPTSPDPAAGVSAGAAGDGRAELGIDALELFVAVLSQSEPDVAGSDSFYDRLCEAVCRLARMRRAVIFRYDATLRRVRAAGAHGMDVTPFADAHVTVESAPIAAQALAGDRGGGDRR